MTRLLLTREVATMLTASEDFVRAHSAELGGVRLGSHPQGPLRFDQAAVERWIVAQRIRPTSRSRRRPGHRRADGVPLLPIPNDVG